MTGEFLEKAKKETEIYVKPYSDKLSNYEKISIEFDKLSIDSLIRLNGQFLFATPALAIVISKNYYINIIIAPMLFFCFGLIFSAISLILARLSSQAAIDYYSMMENYHMNQVNHRLKSQGMQPEAGNLPDKAENIWKSGQNSTKWAERYGYASLAAIILGCISFAVQLYRLG